MWKQALFVSAGAVLFPLVLQMVILGSGAWYKLPDVIRIDYVVYNEWAGRNPV